MSHHISVFKPGWEVEQTITLGETTIYLSYTWGISRTSYQDGTYVEFSLYYIPTDEAQRYATILGYEKPWDHYREHEIAHTWLAWRMGFPYSPTLWTVAHKGIHTYGEVTRKAQGMEEWLVTEFQKFVNTGEITAPGAPLQWLVDRGYDLNDLRTEFIRQFRRSLDMEKSTL